MSYYPISLKLIQKDVRNSIDRTRDDMDKLKRETDSKLERVSREVDTKIQKAIDNPLAGK